MARAILLWITVCSLAVFGVSAGLIVVFDMAGGNPSGIIAVAASPNVADRILSVIIKSQFVALPIAALAGAAYMVLLDRQMRLHVPSAFAVLPTAERAS